MVLDRGWGTLNPNREHAMEKPECRNDAETSVEKSAVPHAGHFMATRRPRLRREIAVALTVKAVVLCGLWFAFFSHPQLPKMTEGMAPDRVAAALVAIPQPQPSREPRHDH
jgi:hypothetical protein